MPKAPNDGVVEIDGTPFLIKAGEEYPEGATFREAEPAPSEEQQPPKEKEKEEAPPRSTR